MSFLILFAMAVVISQAPLSLGTPELHRICSNKFRCGEIVADFPFWGGDLRPRDCGHPALQLQCEDNVTTIIEIDDVPYKVLEIRLEAKIMKIAREDYKEGFCPQKIRNTTLDANIFDIMPGYMNLTLLYGCPDMFTSNFSCSIEETGFTKGYILPGPEVTPYFSSCFTRATLPIRILAPFTTQMVTEALKSGFEVTWKVDEDQVCEKCLDSKGKCGTAFFDNKTTCYCQELSSSFQICRSAPAFISPPPTSPETKSPGINDKDKLGVGLSIAGAAIAGILLGGWCIIAIKRRKRNETQSKSRDLLPSASSRGLTMTTASTNRFQSITSYSSPDIGKESTYFGVQVFTYTELQEATDDFNPSRELGDGGFGTVYYGELNDGRIVAVKRLYENNLKRVEQFKNEIKILADIRHPNLVTLYGCTSRHSRELLLVYEYISNGTIADHLHGRRARSCPLPWHIRLSIAIETANALAYLHSRDIIHRDVKTNNILLDSNFRVKVADFGLSRLFPIDVTHVSTAPQGTPGYVDPEYYQCYHLTEKSDVYSLGVVLVELISGKEAVDVTRHRYDINLANMAIRRIQNRALHELVDPRLDFETNCDVRRMVTSMAELAFRCLQQQREMRPSMEEVLEVLRGMWDGELGGQVAEVVDVGADDVGLLKHIPPPLSPDSGASDKWVQIRTM